MNVAESLSAMRQALSQRAYLARLDILDQTASMVKARLYITPDLFIQIYRNDRYNTTNLVLIHAGQRVYARDQLGGDWHRHAAATPDRHDTSAAGRQPVSLSQFLDEVEQVLNDLNLL